MQSTVAAATQSSVYHAQASSQRPPSAHKVQGLLGKSEQSGEFDEHVPLLKAKLPELKEKFPELAKSLQTLEQPAAAPAARLHGAQSACQIADAENRC